MFPGVRKIGAFMSNKANLINFNDSIFTIGLVIKQMK